MQHQNPSFSDIPPELYGEMLAHLPSSNLKLLMGVNKTFRALATFRQELSLSLPPYFSRCEW